MMDLLGVAFKRTTMQECVDEMSRMIDEKNGPHHIITANPEVLLHLVQDSKLHAIHSNASMIVPDGIGIVIASKLLREPMPERIAGIDLIQNVLAYRHDRNQRTRIFLFGSKKDTVKRAADALEKKYPSCEVVGAISGYLNWDDPNEVKEAVSEIAKKEPDLLLAGLGSPKQERFIGDHLHTLAATVSIGCGGTIDVFSGEKKRAPRYIQRIHAEWLYRLIKEPSRIKRQAFIPYFLIKVFLFAIKRR